MRPLAGNFVCLDQSSSPGDTPLYSPSILALPDGRLIAANERSGAWKNAGNNWAYIYTSDDGGLTWTERTSARITHGRLFTSGDSIYYLGHNGNLQIMRSDDRGETWGEQVALSSGQSWHQSACNVWHTRGYVYLVMERTVYPGVISGWGVGVLAPVLMRAKEGDDLTQRASWTFSSELAFADIIPGYRENQAELGLFPIPFFSQSYPLTNYIVPRRPMAPMGWLETNVVQIMDSAHPWFDPEGRTFYLLMRAHTGGSGYGALAKVVENSSGEMETSLLDSPSGTPLLFFPMPGGQMRFHVLYDEESSLYWLLGSQSTDSMIRLERMPAERFDLPNNERQRLVLHFSSDLIHWQFAGLVDKTDAPNSSRHYASMDIDGEDLVILSRSGDAQAATAHNGNLITFHRVKNFRSLAY